MSYFSKYTELQNKLEYQFNEPSLLLQALMHPSFTNDNRHKFESIPNQRLEFLGDSVLGIVVAKFLFNKYPTFREGNLTIIKH